MKITDPDVIKTGEKELIDSVKQDLDWEAVKEIIIRKISSDAFKTSGGEIVVHDNQVAFRITLDLNMPFSLMFDRDGNYIEEKDDAAEGLQKPPAETEDPDISVEDKQDGEAGIPSDVEMGDPELQPGEENALESQGSVDFDESEDPDQLEKSQVSDGELDEFDLSDFEDEDIDEDIDDILKESKEFWEQKK